MDVVENCSSFCIIFKSERGENANCLSQCILQILLDIIGIIRLERLYKECNINKERELCIGKLITYNIKISQTKKFWSTTTVHETKKYYLEIGWQQKRVDWD